MNKRLTLFESSIIGFFVGAIISVYMIYLHSTGSYTGQILHWVSLSPVMDYFSIPYDKYLVLPLLFYLAVYTLYGLIIGLIFRIGQRMKMGLMLFMALIIIIAVVEQGTGPQFDNKAHDMNVPIIAAAVIHSVSNRSEQYFGNEAVGDLNGDNLDDVAFIIFRDDPDRGMLYYLAAAVKTPEGRTGTNLVFLGEKVELATISINSRVVDIVYSDMNSRASSTDKIMKFALKDGQLARINDK